MYKRLKFNPQIGGLSGFMSIIQGYSKGNYDNYLNDNEELEERTCLAKVLVGFYKVTDFFFDIRRFQTFEYN